jgi:TatD DNase family protein
LFDSHCHLDFPAFDADRIHVWQRAVGAGVQRLFVPGAHTSQHSLMRLRCEIPDAQVGIGLHPYFLQEVSTAERTAWLDQFGDHFVESGACAVGECGLDRPLARRLGPGLDEQATVLRRHVEWARELRVPLVLHVVGAHGLALDVLEEGGPLAAGGVVHAYSGPPELIPRYSRLGFHFGFGAAVLRSAAKKSKAALLAVDPQRLLLETDAPDQCPAEFDQVGLAGRNEPAALRLIAEGVAVLRGTSVGELAKITTENAQRLFG